MTVLKPLQNKGFIDIILYGVMTKPLLIVMYIVDFTAAKFTENKS